MTALLEKLVEQGPVLTDGAWGTQLQGRGLAPGQSADGWNLSRPDVVEAVARAYVEAGSRVILTNSFRANRIAMEKDPDLDKVVAINRAAVEISRRASGGRALVFASMGPSGKLLVGGDVDERALRAAFAEQATALADAGADALVLETMTDLAEARVALEAALPTGLPVIVSMVFDSGRNRDRTMMGTTPQQAATELARLGAHAVGANCGVGVESAASLCRALASATTLPVWIKPNAGLPRLHDGRVVYDTSPEAFAAYLPELSQAGAAFIGGCCGTTPAFIAALAARHEHWHPGLPHL